MSLIDTRRLQAAAAARFVEREAARERRARNLRELATTGSWTSVDEPARIFARARRLGIDLPAQDTSERAGKRLLERILLRDERVSASFLRRGARVSRLVGRIHIRDELGQLQGFGTGFMVSDRLMLTNHHVLPGAEFGLSVLELDFVEDLEEVVPTAVFPLSPETFFITSAELDYTLVALGPAYDAAQAALRGWLPLIPTSGKVVVGEAVNLIQHPAGKPQRVALRANEVLDVFDDYLHYGADTEPGASGSPVCNDQWQLAALHRSGVPGLNAAGDVELSADGEVARWVANEGVRVSSIVSDAVARVAKAPAARDLLSRCFRSPLAFGGSAGTLGRVSVRAGGAEPSAPLPALPSGAAFAGGAGGSNGVGDPALLPAGLPPLAPRRLEAITVRRRRGAADEALQQLGAAGWVLRDVPGEPQSADLRPPDGVGVREAWELVHRLRSLPDEIEEAEPSWIVESIAELPSDGAELREANLLGRSSRSLPKTWALDLIRVRDAWRVPPPAGGKALGEGVRVAHPDSGYTRHAELVESAATLDIASGHDFVDDRADPLDDAGFHGTGTASVLASTEAGELMGAAPRATLIPLRVAEQGLLLPEPVLLESGAARLRDAIDHAIAVGCHVISISLGWFENAALHRAIRRAWDSDIIIVAAAGNYTGPLVVWPGRYPETLCMSGCDADRRVWGGSAFGVGVDFSAPAEDVWKARGNVAGVERSSGTSFATALAAGVAALWLAHHGRAALLARYAGTGIKLAEVFRRVLTLSSDEKPGGLLSFGWGPIINAERALGTPLPAPADIERSPERELVAINERTSSLARALDLLGREPVDGRALLARSYGVSERVLESVPAGFGDELVFHALNDSPGSGVALESFALHPAAGAQVSGALAQRLGLQGRQ